MRNQVFVQEQHLLEAVNRKVINDQQMQEVLSIARSMGQQHSMPDMTWLTFVQCTVLAGMILIPAIACMAQTSNGHPTEMLPFALLGTVALLAMTKGAQRFGLGKPVAGMAAMGASFWAGGFAITLLASTVFNQAFARYWEYGNASYDAHRTHESLVYIGGMVAMTLASLGIGKFFKVPATAATVGFAAIFGWMSAAEFWMRSNRQHLDDKSAAVALVMIGVLLLASAFIAERLQKNSRYDVAFWLHTAGLLPIGFAGCISIDKAEQTVLFWVIAAAATVFLGTKIDRKSYIVAGCAALFGYIPFAAQQAHMGDSGVGLGMAFSTFLVGLAVLIVRSVYVARAKDGMNDSAQSVWG
jgi:hypothetical protein